MYYSVINGPELMELQNDSTVNVQAIKRTLMMVPMQKKKIKLDWAVLQDVTTVDSALIEVTRRFIYRFYIEPDKQTSHIQRPVGVN